MSSAYHRSFDLLLNIFAELQISNITTGIHHMPSEYAFMCSRAVANYLMQCLPLFIYPELAP